MCLSLLTTSPELVLLSDAVVRSDSRMTSAKNSQLGNARKTDERAKPIIDCKNAYFTSCAFFYTELKCRGSTSISMHQWRTQKIGGKGGGDREIGVSTDCGLEKVVTSVFKFEFQIKHLKIIKITNKK